MQYIILKSQDDLKSLKMTQKVPRLQGHGRKENEEGFSRWNGKRLIIIN